MLTFAASLIVAVATALQTSPPAATTPVPPAPTAPTPGQRLTFDFKDPKGVNGFLFLLDSTLEPIAGTGTGLSGTVQFDPTDPTTATGTIKAEAKSLRTTNERMASVLAGADWLDVEKNPTVEVKLIKVTAAEAVAVNTVQTQVAVEVTIKGKTVPMTIPVKATYLPGRLGDRVMGAKGDLLMLRSQFTVKRGDFAIKPDTGPDVVAEEIQITVAIAGVRKSE